MTSVGPDQLWGSGAMIHGDDCAGQYIKRAFTYDEIVSFMRLPYNIIAHPQQISIFNS